MKKIILSFILLTLQFVIFAQSPGTETYGAGIAHEYYNQILRIAKQTPGFTPPVVSRAMGYTGLTLYEAVVPGISDRTSLKGLLTGFTGLPEVEPGKEYHWPTVANNALGLISDSLFENTSQANKDSIHLLRNSWNSIFQSQISPSVFNDSKMFGEAIALAIFEYSRTDGGHKGYLSNFPVSYSPPVGPGLWEQTDQNTALQPYWGNNRTFVFENSQPDMVVGPQIPFSTDTASAFYKEALEVYNTVLNITPEQDEIARFWADDPGVTSTPPGHSISLLRQALIKEKSNLASAAIAYCQMGITMGDAFVVCWKIKYAFNKIRPLTYINRYIDSNWTTVISTPPFPEYPSGHSTQAGASKVIFEKLFGKIFTLEDHTHSDRGFSPRVFYDFESMAAEAAVSRLYGGIHFASGNNDGLTCGKQVGENVSRTFNGTLTRVNYVSGKKMKIYPVPATTELFFESGLSGGMSVAIFSVSGIKEMEMPAAGRMDISNLISGVHFLVVKDSAGMIVSHQKIIKM